MICAVVGARPNFMKIAPVVLELKRRRIPHMLVHTGQHYDSNMSDIFFDQLGMPAPDIYLGIGSDSHTRQTARIMMGFEDVCKKYKPDFVVVGGDVNSTMAVALVTAKFEIGVGHVEAGLRSFDRSMPEEINRIVTDHLSELLFTTEESGNQNLLKEGIDAAMIHFVGNCMMDSLMKHVEVAVNRKPWESFDLPPQSYALLTLHRPSNVDQIDSLASVMEIIGRVSERIPVIFPVHPRTREKLEQSGTPAASSIKLCEPLPYLTFVGLLAKARFVLTDSGGIQEETTVLDVPCLTLRKNTERPVTIEQGTNRLVGMDTDLIHNSVDEILAGEWRSGTIPSLWDGNAATRIVDILQRRKH